MSGIIVLCGGASQAAERLPPVTLEVPADFPTGLPVIVSGTIPKLSASGWSGELTHPLFGERTIVAQCAAGSDRVWFALTADARLLGQRLECAAAPTSHPPRVTVQEHDTHCDFHEGQRLVLTYQSAPITQFNHTRAGYVHPLHGLDGEMLTEVFPKDHRHHQGVFWAWHQLWLADRQIGDPWVTKDHLVEVQEVRVVDQGPVFATLDIRAHWTSPLVTDAAGVPQPIVEERTRIRLFHSLGDAQYVDFTVQLTPRMPDVKIGGSEDVKGYSGFTVRVVPPQDIALHDAAGRRTEDAIQTTSAWADVTGSFREGATSGVAMLTHPTLAQFPPRWVLRHYGMQNVAYPGREPITLDESSPVTLRLRLVLHRGHTEQARIVDHQRVFEWTP